MATINISKKISSKIFNFIKIKKIYIKQLKNASLNLKTIKKKGFQDLYQILLKNSKKQEKSNFLLSYIISFYFSQSNSILQISNANGQSKLFCSAGLVDFKGKQKISRKLVLIKFLKILSLTKLKTIKNKPIALHFKNVNFNKYFIIKKLKSKFFIKTIKDFSLTSYNGCRKKKKKR